MRQTGNDLLKDGRGPVSSKISSYDMSNSNMLKARPVPQVSLLHEYLDVSGTLAFCSSS
jgi:hypothetical protein